MNNPFNEFLKSNSWWIALIFLGLIVVAIVAIYLSGLSPKKAKAPEKGHR
jgi:hypothetical protein